MASAPEREGLPLPFSNLDTRSCSPATYLSARDGLSADTEAVPSPDPDLESGIVRQLMSPVATFRLSQEEPAVVALRGGNRPPRAVNDDSLTASTVSNTSTASSKTTDSTATATRADATTHSSNSTSIRTNPFLSAAASSITTTPAHSTHRVSANGEKQPSRPPTPYPGTSRCSGGDGGDNSHSQDNIHGSGNNTKAKTLSAYHLVTISIGASIGTGLFLGTGTSLARAGPAGSLLAYALVASVLYSVMESLAEMGAYAPPQAGGGGVAAGFAAAWVGEGVAFAVGWVYWFGWAITWALDLTAAGLIIQYWQSSISIGVWIAVFLVVFTCTNLIPVRWFANVEAWLASVKVITVVGFAIFGICIVSGGSPSGNSPLGFRYWSWPFSISATESQSLTAPSNVVDTGPGPFGAGFVFPLPLGAFTGFWSVLIQACFSYQGAELVSLGLSELAPPNSSSSQIQVRRVATSWKTSFPFAVRSAFLLITLLFLITVLMIGLLVPASDSRLLLSSGTSAAASPFVIATDRAGIPSLAGLINAVLLTAILSAGNANVFSGSRILAALAEDGLAPSWFGRQRTWRGGVQGWGVLATSAVGLLAFLNLGEATGKVFLWLLGICSVSGVLTWLFVGVAHVRLIAAMKAQRRDRNTELLGGCRRGYRSRFQPWLAWWGIGWNIVILVTQGFTAFVPRFDGREFAFAYVSILLFLALLVGHGLWTGRWKWVELSDIPLRDPESR